MHTLTAFCTFWFAPLIIAIVYLDQYWIAPICFIWGYNSGGITFLIYFIFKIIIHWNWSLPFVLWILKHALIYVTTATVRIENCAIISKTPLCHFIIAEFLNLGTIDILGWILLCCRVFLCTVGCLEASLAYAHEVRVAATTSPQHLVVTIKIVWSHCQINVPLGGEK